MKEGRIYILIQITFSYGTYFGKSLAGSNGIPIILPALENSSYIISNSINIEQLSCCCVRWIIMSNTKNDLLPTRTDLFLCPFYAEIRAQDNLACVENVPVRFRSQKRGSRVKNRAELLLSLQFSRGQNRKSRSSVFLCSETKRKTLAAQAYDSQ